MSWWSVSSPSMTCAVRVEDGVIVEGAPIVQRFIGQPAKNLGDWLRQQGECEFHQISELTHTFTWGNNPKRATLKGRHCRILLKGEMRSVMVEFENGQREIVSHRALRGRRDSELGDRTLVSSRGDLHHLPGGVADLNCSKCGREMNERIETVWQKVTGWEKKRDQGGTNHIALREPLPEVMCAGCMQLMLDGLDPGQQSLI